MAKANWWFCKQHAYMGNDPRGCPDCIKANGKSPQQQALAAEEARRVGDALMRDVLDPLVEAHSMGYREGLRRASEVVARSPDLSGRSLQKLIEALADRNEKERKR